MRLTFYSGAGEIGGNRILLEDKGAKIYLDFGKSFDFGNELFLDYLRPRTVNGLEVLFEFNLIQKIPKLYRKEVLRFTDLKYQRPDVDAIIISHSHPDHIGHLEYVDETIPIYMGHGTKALLDAYMFLYKSFVDYGTHININLFKSGETFKVKHLKITPIHVEHSVPGAYGFIIKTSKGNIAYTGDFRLHGPKVHYSQDFIKEAEKTKPIILLCEGTRMSAETDHNLSEAEINRRFHDIISKSKGTVFAHFSMSNVDRFNSIYKAATDNKRIMVIDTRLAYIMSQMKEKVNYPDPLIDPNIRVYYRFAKTCQFEEKDYIKWEREYCKKMITYKEIKENPRKYVMFLGFYKLMELVYIQPKKADFVYSMSEHFYEGDENAEMRKVFENWMKHFKIRFHKAHCSGHASQEDLKETIRRINPKILIPIHTKNPEGFKKWHKNVKIMKNGKRIEI